MILQHHGAQRAVYVETPAAASLSRHMPLPHESSSERVVTSPMTGTLVEVGVSASSMNCVHLFLCSSWLPGQQQDIMV
jgi:hypothetical protein